MSVVGGGSRAQWMSCRHSVSDRSSGLSSFNGQWSDEKTVWKSEHHYTQHPQNGWLFFNVSTNSSISACSLNDAVCISCKKNLTDVPLKDLSTGCQSTFILFYNGRWRETDDWAAHLLLNCLSSTVRHTDRQRQACCSFTEVHLQHQHQHQQCHCSLFCACYGLHKPETDRKSVSLSCWNISCHVTSCHVRGWTEVWAPNSGFISVNTGALYGLGCVCVFEGFSKASTRVSGQVSVRVLL